MKKGLRIAAKGRLLSLLCNIEESRANASQKDTCDCELSAQSTELTRGPFRLYRRSTHRRKSSAYINLIWRGNIARLSQWERGRGCFTRSSDFYLPLTALRGGGGQHPVGVTGNLLIGTR